MAGDALLVGFAVAVQVLLLALRWAGIVTAPWYIVLAPTWLLLLVGIGTVVLIIWSLWE